ncbi:MAG: hypothetical protein PHF24_05105 [Syntrophomonas sp.]|nr:hypothetical protein [Syntrophomonas sp.]
MAFDSKNIKRDLGKKPAPQYFNPIADDYEVSQGHNGAIFVDTIPANTIPTGQKTNIGTSAVPLGSGQLCRELLIQSDPDNENNILVGNATAQYICLVPGAFFSTKVSNINLIYVRSVAGTGKVNWIAEEVV